jgi:LysR family transcriptional regulator, low CO2-responsive transcriptional regulator
VNNPLDLQKLRIFVAIAQSGSFTRAAEQLTLTQPTVSQQLAALEAQVGVALLERQPRRVHLTAAGAALLPYARRLLALANEGARAARDAAGLADRTLRLGVGNVLAVYLLPDVLRRYRTLHPDVLMRITTGNSADLLESVAQGEIELALVGSPAIHAQAESTPFMHDRLMIVVAPDDPWAGRASATLAELRGRTLLTREPGSALHASVERLLGAETLSGDNVIVLGETEAIKRSVEAGLGVALIQGIAVRREVEAGALWGLQLADGDDRRTYSFARQRGHTLSSAAQGLVALLI